MKDPAIVCVTPPVGNCSRSQARIKEEGWSLPKGHKNSGTNLQ